jgi:hypothetical protein
MVGLIFFILIVLFLVYDSLLSYVKSDDNKNDHLLFILTKKLIKDSSVVFKNRVFEKHRITYLISFIKDKEITYFVVLNNNFKTLHEIDIKYGLVRVKLFTLSINKQRINDSHDLLYYLNNKTSFKILDHSVM